MTPALGKRIETRSWATSYRGPLAIHQTLAPGPKGTTEADLRARCVSEFFYPELYVHIDRAAELPRGAIVAVAELYSCLPTVLVENIGGFWADDKQWLLSDKERALGDYTPGRWAWLLADIRALPVPIATRGYQGLWNVPPEIEAQIARQLERGVPCPHCGAAHDLAGRVSGDRVYCPTSDAWYQVQFVDGGGAALRACDAPAAWPKEARR